MNLLAYFQSIDLKEIERFIDEKQEEHLNLEFKTVNHPNYNNENREFDKKNLSEALSGFANSNGGIIIWGIKAQVNSQKQDVAKELKPIAELTRFLNTLNRLEGEAVTPVIEGVVHQKIETTEDSGYIKTYVPPSDNAPHMANFAGKHYYKRSGDSFYQCEHFDIIDMLNRKRSPVLQVDLKNETLIKPFLMNNKSHLYSGTLVIKNTGRVSAKFISLDIHVSQPFHVATKGINDKGGRGMRTLPTKEEFIKYIGGIDLVIHPGAYHEVDKIVLNEFQRRYDYPSDLSIHYRCTAENMPFLEGVIERKKEDILALPPSIE